MGVACGYSIWNNWNNWNWNANHVINFWRLFTFPATSPLLGPCRRSILRPVESRFSLLRQSLFIRNIGCRSLKLNLMCPSLGR